MNLQRTPLLPKLDEADRSIGLPRLGRGPSVNGMQPLPAQGVKLAGITKDSSGTPVGGCTVKVFRTDNDLLVGQVLSDPTTGVYEYSVQPGDEYYVVAYKAGAPDLAGTTVNTLTGL